jgi:predicted DNA-binding transcriptional regulator AlpA
VEAIRRRAEAQRRFGVGKTTFDERIAPRLTRVMLGPRLPGFTESSILRVIGEMIAESKEIVPAPMPTAEQQRAGRERRRAAEPKRPRRRS